MFTDRHANSLLIKRRRQPWPKDRTFKILSLDGGGIKGIYTAEMLCRCEEKFGCGEPVARYFDMIAGTSDRRHHCPWSWPGYFHGRYRGFLPRRWTEDFSTIAPAVVCHGAAVVGMAVRRTKTCA